MDRGNGSIITLTTDFGSSDPFVGLIKGMILGIAPHTVIVDMSHEVPPQDIFSAALTLETVLGVFPLGSIHLGVVDPGVGSSRRAIAVQTEHYQWVGPDNGIFQLVLAREQLRRAVVLNNVRYHRHPTCNTFHGRDIFAPAAAHLAQGVPIESLGEPINDLVELPITHPIPTADGLELCVLRADRFGNLITNLTQDQFDAWRPETAVQIQVADQTLNTVSRTFSDVRTGQFVAYFGSTGRLEIALRDGDASQRLGADRNMVIKVKGQ